MTQLKCLGKGLTTIGQLLLKHIIIDGALFCCFVSWIYTKNMRYALFSMDLVKTKRNALGFVPYHSYPL